MIEDENKNKKQSDYCIIAKEGGGLFSSRPSENRRCFYRLRFFSRSKTPCTRLGNTLVSQDILN